MSDRPERTNERARLTTQRTKITDQQGAQCPDKKATPIDQGDAHAIAPGCVSTDESASVKHVAHPHASVIEPPQGRTCDPPGTPPPARVDTRNDPGSRRLMYAIRSLTVLDAWPAA